MRVVADEANNLVAHYDYSPWGATMRAGGTDPDILRYRYTGQEYDTETGLYNYRARLYDGETGRFLSVDPKAHLFPGWSPYAGMLNNPISNIDPDGQEPVTLTVLAVAAVVGGGLNMWSNKDKIKDWRSGLAYFATGAVGGGASLFNPAIGGAITSVGNVLVDAATGNLPDWDNPWEVGAYAALRTLDGIGAAGVGKMAEAGVTLFKNLSGSLFQQSFQMAGGGMIGTISTGITLPEATLILTQIPSHTLAANGGRVFASGVIRGGGGAAAKGTTSAGRKALRPLGKYLESVDDVMANPNLLKGKSPWQVEGILGKTKGWKIETLGKGSQKGKGWVFREYTTKGNPTGRMLRWHPGGGHHGVKPYWRVKGYSGDLGGVIF